MIEDSKPVTLQTDGGQQLPASIEEKLSAADTLYDSNDTMQFERTYRLYQAALDQIGREESESLALVENLKRKIEAQIKATHPKLTEFAFKRKQYGAWMKIQRLVSLDESILEKIKSAKNDNGKPDNHTLNMLGESVGLKGDIKELHIALNKHVNIDEFIIQPILSLYQIPDPINDIRKAVIILNYKKRADQGSELILMSLTKSAEMSRKDGDIKTTRQLYELISKLDPTDKEAQVNYNSSVYQYAFIPYASVIQTLSDHWVEPHQVAESANAGSESKAADKTKLPEKLLDDSLKACSAAYTTLPLPIENSPIAFRILLMYASLLHIAYSQTSDVVYSNSSLQAYKEALEIFPTSFRFKLGYAIALHASVKHIDASNPAQKIARLKESIAFYCNALVNLGRSEKTFLQMATAWEGLADTLMALSRFEQETYLCKEANELSKKLSSLSGSRGKILTVQMATAAYAKAAQLYKTAISADSVQSTITTPIQKKVAILGYHYSLINSRNFAEANAFLEEQHYSAEEKENEVDKELRLMIAGGITEKSDAATKKVSTPTAVVTAKSEIHPHNCSQSMDGSLPPQGQLITNSAVTKHLAFSHERENLENPVSVVSDAEIAVRLEESTRKAAAEIAARKSIIQALREGAQYIGPSNRTLTKALGNLDKKSEPDDQPNDLLDQSNTELLTAAGHTMLEALLTYAQKNKSIAEEKHDGSADGQLPLSNEKLSELLNQALLAAYVSETDISEANEHFESLLKRTTFIHLYASYTRNKALLAEASNNYQHLLTLDKESFQAKLGEAATLYELGNYEEATQVYCEAILLEQDLTKHYVDILQDQNLKNNNQAVPEAKKSTANYLAIVAISDPHTHLQLATAWHGLGESLAQSNPQFLDKHCVPAMLNSLGLTKLNTKIQAAHKKAKEHYMTALQCSDPDFCSEYPEKEKPPILTNLEKSTAVFGYSHVASQLGEKTTESITQLGGDISRFRALCASPPSFQRLMATSISRCEEWKSTWDDVERAQKKAHLRVQQIGMGEDSPSRLGRNSNASGQHDPGLFGKPVSAATSPPKSNPTSPGRRFLDFLTRKSSKGVNARTKTTSAATP